MLRLLDPIEGDNILNRGCGSGYNSLILKEYGAEVYGIDLSHEMVKYTQSRGINAEVADLQNFSLNKKFNKILYAGSLEFCTILSDVFKNIINHLSENGIIVLVVSGCLFGA